MIFVVCRGSRKGTLIRSALLEAESAYLSCQPKGAVERCPFVVVELHGSVLDDDGTAARELCRQLSIGSTLPRSRKSAMEHYLRFTLDSLKEGRAGNVPVFILLHDFDLFARRAKQTLLYNLFDITQSPKYQVCVIGTTTRLDATELLEKRLRSRFSQRQILLGLPSLSSTKALVHSLLHVEAEAVQSHLAQIEVSFVPQTVAAAVSDWNKAVSALLLSRKAESTVSRSRHFCALLAFILMLTGLTFVNCTGGTSLAARPEHRLAASLAACCVLVGASPHCVG